MPRSVLILILALTAVSVASCSSAKPPAPAPPPFVAHSATLDVTAGIKVLTIVITETYTAYREESTHSSGATAMSLDGGVGGVVY